MFFGIAHCVFYAETREAEWGVGTWVACVVGLLRNFHRDVNGESNIHLVMVIRSIVMVLCNSYMCFRHS